MADTVDKIPRVNLLPVSTPAAFSNSPVTPPLTPLLSDTVQITDSTSTAANQPISKFVCVYHMHIILLINYFFKSFMYVPIDYSQILTLITRNRSNLNSNF